MLFKNLFRRPEPQAVDPITAAIRRKPRKVRRALVELDKQTREFRRQDIGRWRRAHQLASDVDNPRRIDLYNIYADAVLNAHLEGCMGQIETAVKSRAFIVRDSKTGNGDEAKTAIFAAPWFRDFLHLALDTFAWGHSLVELGGVLEARNMRTIDSVRLIPREHVIPERGLILRSPQDEFSQGIDYRGDRDLNRYLIEMSAGDTFGFLLKVAPEAISIKNMAGFWDTFGELFGIPIRWASSPSDDPADKASIMSALRQMGAAAYALFPEGTEIHFLETQKGDAFNVFDQRIIRAQSNISKAVLNQTMTLEDGASLSQAEVHLDIFNRVVDSRLEYIADVVNWQLLPRLQMMGLPFADTDRFEWDDAVSYTPEQQLEIERLLLQYYDIDPEYFKIKYNVDITGVKSSPGFGGAVAELKKKSSPLKTLDELYGI